MRKKSYCTRPPNLTLDGIEKLLLKKYSASSTGYIHPNYNKEKVHLCRYADDFIVTAKNKETLLEIQQTIEKFMEEREGRTELQDAQGKMAFFWTLFA